MHHKRKKQTNSVDLTNIDNETARYKRQEKIKDRNAN